jgi:hypothetical protein
MRSLAAILLLVMSLPVLCEAWKGADQRPDDSPFSLRVDVDLVILNVAVTDGSTRFSFAYHSKNKERYRTTQGRSL